MLWREVDRLRLRIVGLEVGPAHFVEHKTAHRVGSIELFIVRVKNHRIRIRDPADVQLLLEAAALHVARANAGISVGALCCALERGGVGRLGPRVVFDFADDVAEQLRALVVRSAALGGDFDGPLVLPRLVDERVQVLIQLVERQTRPVRVHARLAFLGIPGIAGHIAHVRPGFPANRLLLLSVVGVRFADFFQEVVSHCLGASDGARRGACASCRRATRSRCGAQLVASLPAS